LHCWDDDLLTIAGNNVFDIAIAIDQKADLTFGFQGKLA
jgi:hypothetical protein